jgi:hypothetical protein
LGSKLAPYSEFPYVALALVALATLTACITVHRHPSTGAGEGRSPNREADQLSCSARYGARYFAAILLGGGEVGVSVISELNPCPPVI